MSVVVKPGRPASQAKGEAAPANSYPFLRTRRSRRQPCLSCIFFLWFSFALFPPETGECARQVSLFSVQMHSLAGPPPAHRRALQWAAEMGAGQVRDELFWHLVEQEKGVYRIPAQGLENLRATSASGLGTILILDYGNPLYDAGLPPTSEEALRAFAGYCAHMAEQLQGQVCAFEIWNEPNTDGFWKPEKDPVAYANLLRHAYPAIKRADPGATVLGCSLAGLDDDFFDAVAEQGGLAYMDAVSVHTYCFPGSPEEKRKFEEVRELHRHVEAMAGRAVPLWITEMGWPTQTGGGLSELRQAELLARTYLLAAAQPEIVTLCWYWLGPDGPDEYWAEDRYSLTHPDGSPKPGRLAYGTLARLLQDASFVRSLDDFGPLLRALLFKKEEDFFLAVWSADDQGRDIELPGGWVQTIETLSGRRTTVPREIPSLRIHVDGEPLLLHGRPPERLSLRLSQSRFDYQPRSISSGVLHREPWDPKIAYRFLPRWKERLETVYRDEGRVEFRVARGNPRGPARADLVLSATGDKAGFFALLAMNFTVTEPVQIIIQPVIEDASNAVQVCLQPVEPEGEVSGRLSVVSAELGLNERFEDLRLDQAALSRIVPVTGAITANTVAEVTASLTLAGGEEIVRNDVISFLRAARARTPVLMDGALSEWDLEPSACLYLGSREQYCFSDMQWDGPQDASARVMLLWEPEWLYLAATVQDDLLSDTATGAEVYQNDGFELYFDTNPLDDPLKTTYTPDVHQWGVCASGGEAVVYRWSQRSGPSEKGKACIRQIPGGYVVEARIPAEELTAADGSSTFSGSFHAGLHFGFTIALNDDDSPDTTHPFHQDLQLQWSRRRNAFLNPQSFADLFFVE